MSFAAWYNENKDSDDLREGYLAHKDEAKEFGEKPLTYRQWCKERYEELMEY